MIPLKCYILFYQTCLSPKPAIDIQYISSLSLFPPSSVCLPFSLSQSHSFNTSHSSHSVLCSFLFNLLSPLFPAGRCHRESLLIFFLTMCASCESLWMEKVQTHPRKRGRQRMSENQGRQYMKTKEEEEKRKETVLLYVGSHTDVMSLRGKAICTSCLFH